MSRKHFRCWIVLGLALAAGAVPAVAQQNTAVGLWQASYFDDATPDLSPIVVRQICVLPGGTWSGNVVNWGGRWFQKGLNAAGIGNHVRFLGNYLGGAGNDGVELDFVSSGQMTGTWTEWRDDLSFLVWARVSMTRVSSQCSGPSGDAGAMSKDGNPLRKDSTQR